MSRILRRPMFRGGRVDSRGTGITSGLGYAKGGSVNTPKRGLVDGPGGYSGATLAWNLLKAGAKPIGKYGMKGMEWLFSPKGGWSDKVINNPSYWNILKNMGSSRAGQGLGALNPMKDPLVGGVVKVPLGATKLLGKGIKKSPYGAAAVGADYVYNDRSYLGDAGDWIKEQWDEYSPWADEKAGGREFVGEEAEIVGDPRDLPTEKQTLEEIIAQIKAQEEAKRQELIDLMTPKELTKEEQLDELKEKKAMIRELYGSGRGEDASRMLMTAASRLLEPGATVKSGFAKALGDEAKVESKRIKYDEAAATAAVNSFLTGEKDYDSLMKQMAIIKYGNRDKLAIAAEALDLEGKDWDSALTIVQDRYKGNKKRDSFLVVSETLKGKFGKPVAEKEGEFEDIDVEDLIEGFTILTTDAGKIIIEKIGDEIRKRTDLLI